MRSWQVQEAKAGFSQLLRDVAAEGPQLVTVRGKPKAVVISTDDYERLRSPKPNLVDFIRDSPFWGTDLELERDPSASRAVDL